jgi:hypothetical protein
MAPSLEHAQFQCSQHSTCSCRHLSEAQEQVKPRQFFLQHWSGRSFFPPPSITHHIFTDASGSWGCGGFTEDVGWFQVPWPTTWQDVDISVKELVPVIIASVLWGPQWESKHICFHSDNMAVVACCSGCRPNIPPSRTCCTVFHSSVPIMAFTSRLGMSRGC